MYLSCHAMYVYYMITKYAMKTHMSVNPCNIWSHLVSLAIEIIMKLQDTIFDARKGRTKL